MIWRCDLVPQYERYKDEIDRAIGRVLGSGRYILAGEVAKFEEEFAAYNGTAHCVSVANGTDALILSLKAMGIGPGDEIVTTPFTAIPTVSAIIAVGATPRFADIDPDTYLLDVEHGARAVTARTKAIIPVHLFGNMVDIDALRDAVGSGIKILEDACQAHGSTLRGKRAGSMGDVGTFSFYPTKNLGAYGDGGAVVTNDGELAGSLKKLRMYGMVDYNHIDINGVNSRLDELQAAVLRVKLKHLDAMNKERHDVVARYRAGLDGSLFAAQAIPPGVVSNFHVYATRFKGNRDAFMKRLDVIGVQTNVYYRMPLYAQKANAYLGVPEGACPNAEELCRNVMALPMYPELSPDVQKDVIEILNVEGRKWND